MVIVVLAFKVPESRSTLQDVGRFIVAVKGTQKDDRSTRISDVGILVLTVIAYVVFSFAACFIFSAFIRNYSMACLVSFSTIGFASYLGMHFVLPVEMSRFDARLLHELAKRKLVEFKSVDEDSNKLE